MRRGWMVCFQVGALMGRYYLFMYGVNGGVFPGFDKYT